MKKILLYIGIAIVAIGCAKDNIGETTLSAGAIEFTAAVESDDTRLSDDSDVLWKDGDAIGVFTAKSTVAEHSNMEFTISDATDGTMTTSDATLYATESRTYYAYYPYDAAYDLTSTIDIDCETLQNTLLLWATETTESQQVELTFKHMLPKVTFNLMAGGKDVTSLDGATAKLVGANATATFDIKGDGSFTSTSGDITLTIENGKITAYLLPVDAVKDNVTLWITAKDPQDSSLTNTFYYPITTEAWASGSSYEYNITVGEAAYVQFQRNVDDTKNMTKVDNVGTIDNILAKFRRCLMYSDGTSRSATICYLNDSNSTQYSEDSSTATLDGSEGDVMVYFPEYWYKYENVDDDYFRYHFSEVKVDGYVHVKASLVGAYKAYNDNGKLYSRSGVTPAGYIYQPTFIEYAEARGEGYQIIDYEQHCTIAMMLYARYLDRDTQTHLGAGGADNSTLTGTTNSIGNADTSGEASNYVNGLGIEGVFGGVYEWVQGVTISSYVWTITNPLDGSERKVTAGSSGGYITKMAIEGYSGDDYSTQYFDMVPTEASGDSYSTYYADYYFRSSSDDRVLARSGNSSDTDGGVACSYASYGSSTRSTNYGSRLAFRGTITEASVTDYKTLVGSN